MSKSKISRSCSAIASKMSPVLARIDLKAGQAMLTAERNKQKREQAKRRLVRNPGA